MEPLYVRVSGIASNMVKKKFKSFYPKGTFDAVNQCLLFLDYSDFDIPATVIFSFLINTNEPALTFPIKARILWITQNWALPFEGIPQGHNTLCNFEMDAESLTLIKSTFPVHDTWLPHKWIVLSTSNTIV